MHGRGERAARRWDIVAAVALAGWLLFDLTARTLFGSAPWPQSAVDYRIMYDAGRHVVAAHEYPAGYPYPPPATAAHAASAVFPFAVSAALWLALTGLAAGACYLALARTLGLHERPGALLLLPLAHAVAAYYFQWDMRSVNCNLVVLAAVLFGCAALARGRDAAAGFWFAAAIALKVFPVLVLPYLAWTRRWRALAWAVAFSLLFWVVVPAAVYGVGGSFDVYRGWANELTRATDAATKHNHPILISLDKAALFAASGDAAFAKGIALGVCALWVLVGLAGAAACWGNRPRSGASILAHVSLLVLGPAAVSPYLEAYHLVPVVVPAAVLLAVAADARRAIRMRTLAAVGFVLGLAVLKLSSPWPLRGLLVNAQALVLCATAVAVTCAPLGAAVTPPAGASHGVLAKLMRRLAIRANV